MIISQHTLAETEFAPAGVQYAEAFQIVKRIDQ